MPYSDNGLMGGLRHRRQGGDPIILVTYLAGVFQSEAARLLARMLGRRGAQKLQAGVYT
jgi:hypothetical protein